MWREYGLTEDEQLALPLSTYNSLFEQAFNMKHLDLGDGKYELHTQKDKDAQLRLEYEAVKSQLQNGNK